MAQTIKVDGLADLERAMRSLSEDVAAKIGRAAAAAGAGVVRKRARELAPMGTEPHRVGRKRGEVQPGNLKRNIIMKRIKDSGLTHEYGIGWRSGGSLGRDAFYGRFVELGTVKMPARPFMRPALANSQTEAINAVRARLKARIDKANKR